LKREGREREVSNVEEEEGRDKEMSNVKDEVLV